MLRVGLVGTGLIATLKHLPAWRRASPAARVVALCDADIGRARTVAAAQGVSAVYADAAEMLRAQALDVVDVCTPPATHAAVAVAALEAGAHVLVEKPMATTLADCDAMTAAARRASRLLSVAHSDLFYPAFLSVRRRLQRGDVGALRGLRILLSTPTSYITSRPDHWAHRLPGGVLGETGPHAVYMTLAFIPRIEAAHIRARKLLPQYPWSPYEDYRIELAGQEASSSIALTYATGQWAAELELWGEEGMLRADLESQAVRLHRRAALSAGGVGVGTLREAAATVLTAARAGLARVSGRAVGPHEALVQRFLAAVRGQAPAPVSPEEGREAVRVLALLVAGLEGGAGQEAARPAACAESAAS